MLLKKCKHNFQTITNIHGDPINHFGGSRSVLQCTKCHKIEFRDSLDYNCNKVNQFDDIYHVDILQSLQELMFAIGSKIKTKNLNIFDKLGNKIQDIRSKRGK